MTRDALNTEIDATLAAYVGDTTHAKGSDILRWFIKGLIAHKNPQTQQQRVRFLFNRDIHGNIIWANDIEGFHLLRDAVQGDLVRAQTRIPS